MRADSLGVGVLGPLESDALADLTKCTDNLVIDCCQCLDSAIAPASMCLRLVLASRVVSRAPCQEPDALVLAATENDNEQGATLTTTSRACRDESLMSCARRSHHAQITCLRAASTLRGFEGTSPVSDGTPLKCMRTDG